MNKWLKNIIIVFIILIIVIISINFYVVYKTKDKIITMNEIIDYDYDYIIVLGASVKNGEASPMLKERIDAGISAFKLGASDTILMSGDNSSEFYDEVTVMKNDSIAGGIPEEAIELDHAGLSTYESIYRLKEHFGADKILIVSQEYHLYRAIYIAQALGIEADGLNAELENYSGHIFREFREILARNKDFLLSIIKPTPKNIDKNIPSN